MKLQWLERLLQQGFTTDDAQKRFRKSGLMIEGIRGLLVIDEIRLRPLTSILDELGPSDPVGSLQRQFGARFEKYALKRHIGRRCKP